MEVAIRATGQEAMDIILKVMRPYNGWAVAEVSEEAGLHMHAYVEADIEVLRSKIKWALKDFTAKGNGVYSCKMCKDAQNYQQYMAKGREGTKESKVDVLWDNMLSLNVSDLHDKYWAVNAALKKVERKDDIVSMLVKRCLAAKIDVKVERNVAREYYDMCCRTPGLKLDKYGCNKIIDTAIGRILDEIDKKGYEARRDLWLDSRRI